MNTSYRVNSNRVENQEHAKVAENSTINCEHSNKKMSNRRVVEDFKRFSQSKLWELMMKFYDKNGVSSWSDGIVPHFVSSNSFIGRSYAKVLIGILMDLSRKENSNLICHNETLYIVELGAGTGKLAFYILKALEEMKHFISGIPYENIVYVITDFTESNISFCEGQTNLKPFVETGKLDFAKFEAVHDTSLTLRISGKTLHRGELKNPLCIISNYLIDTLCNDLYQVENDVLKEGLVSVGVDDSSLNTSADSLDDHEIFNHLANEYKYRPVNTNYYSGSVRSEDEIHYSRILTWYQNYFNTHDKRDFGASLLIPIGFFSALRNLSDLSAGKIFVISGDKGSCNPDNFIGLSDPHIAVHGSFSLMVNFHAVNLYFLSRGGFALNATQEDTALQVNCYVLCGNESTEDCISTMNGDIEMLNKKRKSQFPSLYHSYEEFINKFSPNDFFVIQKSLKEECVPSLASIVSLIKLSNWDPDIFFKFRDTILSKAPTAGPRLRNDLSHVTSKLWDHYYHLDNDKDIAFELGRLCYGLSLYQDALKYYEISVSIFGEHHVTHHNSGLCHFSLFEFHKASYFFNRALTLNPEYEKSITWLERVTKEMNST